MEWAHEDARHVRFRNRSPPARRGGPRAFRSQWSQFVIVAEVEEFVRGPGGARHHAPNQAVRSIVSAAGLDLSVLSRCSTHSPGGAVGSTDRGAARAVPLSGPRRAGSRIRSSGRTRRLNHAGDACVRAGSTSTAVSAVRLPQSAIGRRGHAFAELRQARRWSTSMRGRHGAAQPAAFAKSKSQGAEPLDLMPTVTDDRQPQVVGGARVLSDPAASTT